MNEFPNELADALELYDIAATLRTKKTIDWKDYGDQLMALTDRLFARPECQNYFDQFEKSFAHLSPDIAHDVVGGVGHSSYLQELIAIDGPWGHKAKNHWNELAEFESEVSGETEVEEWHDRRWSNLQKNTRKLSGKLRLHNLCKWTDGDDGKRFYSDLCSRFTDINISYHRSEQLRTPKELKPLRKFIKRKLESSYLRNLALKISGDLQLEKELLAFCASQSCASLNWDCQSLSADFFVQVYNAFKKKRSIAIEPSKEVAGFIEHTTLMDLVQALKLKRKRNSSYYGLNALSEDEAVSIRTKHHVGSENVHVRIKLGKNTVNREETENDDSDGEEEDKDGSSECNYDCELAKLSSDNWKEGDCEKCEGCECCSSYACHKCGYWVNCRYCEYEDY